MNTIISVLCFCIYDLLATHIIVSFVHNWFWLFFFRYWNWSWFWFWRFLLWLRFWSWRRRWRRCYFLWLRNRFWLWLWFWLFFFWLFFLWFFFFFLCNSFCIFLRFIVSTLIRVSLTGTQMSKAFCLGLIYQNKQSQNSEQKH